MTIENPVIQCNQVVAGGVRDEERAKFGIFYGGLRWFTSVYGGLLNHARQLQEVTNVIAR